MAIFKPTECSPFKGTFDLVTDCPIVLHCKVDTTNTKISGYTIKLYDSRGWRVFPKDIEDLNQRVTYLPDLEEYVRQMFPELRIEGDKDNTGINGTYLTIPFILTANIGPDTVPRNQIIYNILSPTLSAEETYYWEITLYQEVSKSESEEGDIEVDLPTDPRYFDMTMTTGQVVGSDTTRIQTIPFASEAILIDKYIQPVYLSGLEFDPAEPEKWTNSGTCNQVGQRVLIKNYSPELGHIYTETVGESIFHDGEIDPSRCNGFQIFKNGNNSNDLRTTDTIDFIYKEKGITEGGGWTLKDENTSNPYLQEIVVVSKADSDAKRLLPLNSHSITEDSRVVFNNVTLPGTISADTGCSYAGIYHMVIQERKELDDTNVQYTINWYRTPDADSWGELVNKVVLNKADGKNYQISVEGVYGTINKTPFRFVEEKPEAVYSFASTTSKLVIPSNNILNLGSDYAQSIKSITVGPSGNEVTISPMLWSHEPGSNLIYLIDADATQSYNVTFTSYSVSQNRSTTGVIFYNKPKDDDGDGILYIRPYNDIDQNMMLIQADAPNPKYITFKTINKDYWFVTYDEVKQKIMPIEDTGWDIGERYRIKSFYRTSDLNPMTFSAKPIVSIDYTQANRDLEVTVDYTSKITNYVQWKNAQIILRNSRGEVIDMSPDIYSGNIEHTFYGLEAGRYTIDVIVQTNLDYMIKSTEQVTISYTETYVDPTLIGASLSFNQTTCGISVSSGSGNATVYRREIGYSGEEFLPKGVLSAWKQIGKIYGGQTLVDYSVLNHRHYQYMLIYADNKVTRMDYRTNWKGWSVTELIEDDGLSAVAKNVWRFKYNVSIGEITQNIIKNQHDTLSRYPRFSHGEKNHRSGSVNCLLGSQFIMADYRNKRPIFDNETNSWKDEMEAIPIYNSRGYLETLDRYGYSDDDYQSATQIGFTKLTSNQAVDMLDKWEEVCYSGNTKLLRDEKGNGYLVQITSSSHEINESWTRMPTTISFSWVEIGNLGDKIVSSTGNPPAAVFSDGTSLSWEDLIAGVDADRLGYNPDQLSDDTIGSNAFSDSILVSLRIPASVTTIDGNAFEGCASLQTIVFVSDSTNGDLEIYPRAFCDCINLSSFDFVSRLSYIGSEAFRNTKLSAVTIPSNVMIIDGYAFAQDYNPTIKTVVVPTTVEDCATNIFEGCLIEDATVPLAILNEITKSQIKKLVILDGESIDSSVIDEATLLESITFPATVNNIEAGMTAHFNNLTSITVDSGNEKYRSEGNCIIIASSNNLTSGCKGSIIPDGVVTIGYWAFYQCEGLTSIAIPDSVKTISGNAFVGCSNLTTVSFGSASQLTSIETAFSNCTSLPSIHLPDSLQSISMSAFANCSSLSSVNIPSSTTTIGNSVFSGCSALTSVDFATEGSSLTIGQYAFKGCSSLTKVDLPERVTTINASAFSGCSSIQEMTIPFTGQTRKRTGEKYQYPFGYIFGTSSYSGATMTPQTYHGNTITGWTTSNYYIPNALTKVTVLSVLRGTLLDGAFDGCSRLTEINIPQDIVYIGQYSFRNCSGISSFVVPDGTQEVYSEAFRGCASMVELKLPSSITTIGVNAIKDIAQNSDIYCDWFEGDVEGAPWGAPTTANIHYKQRDPGIYGANAYKTWSECGLTSFGTEYAGRDACNQFKTDTGEDAIMVVIPDAVTKVGKNCFRGVTSIQNVKLPESLTEINDYAFYGCSGLTDVELPSSIQRIDRSAFESCAALSGISLADLVNLTAIGANAFSGCNLRDRIDIPDNVTTIGGFCFHNNAVTGVNIGKSVWLISDGAFSANPNIVEMTVDSDNERLYSSGNSIINRSGDILTAGCSTSIIPNGIALISTAAFWGMGITSIEIPASIVQINNYALYTNPNLTSIKFGGTKDQWNAIYKGDNWNGLTGNYTIHCSDGDLPKT